MKENKDVVETYLEDLPLGFDSYNLPNEGEEYDAQEFKPKLIYPKDENYEVEVKLDIINYEFEMYKDFAEGNAFRVFQSQGIKADLIAPYSVYSKKWGPGLQGVQDGDDASVGNSDVTYSCPCGKTKGVFLDGKVCKHCGYPVKRVGIDFNKMGYIILDYDKVIHLNLYAHIERLIGVKNLQDILGLSAPRDEDGFAKSRKDIDVYTKTGKLKKKGSNPYVGLGMIKFREKFDEICQFFLEASKGKKQAIYDLIMANREKVFTRCIPVYTTYLRPYVIANGKFNYEKINSTYNMMAKIASRLNTETFRNLGQTKPINTLLWNFQEYGKKLYNEIVKIASGKKGLVRSLFAGRFNFIARCVITSSITRVDHVRLSYYALCKLLCLSIINTLRKTHNISMQEAFIRWKTAYKTPDPEVYNIINNIIHARPDGYPLIINRNPTLGFGSVMQVFCIGISGHTIKDTNFVMEISLHSVVLPNADFDGDTLNITILYNNDIANAAIEILNPRNNMCISHVDGYMNQEMNIHKDGLVIVNALRGLSAKNYTEADYKELDECLEYSD